MSNNILFEVRLFAITLHSRYGELKFNLCGSHANWYHTSSLPLEHHKNHTIETFQLSTVLIELLYANLL
jgi:hypothetical protein